VCEGGKIIPESLLLGEKNHFARVFASIYRWDLMNLFSLRRHHSDMIKNSL
jgi:hypothetical protein